MPASTWGPTSGIRPRRKLPRPAPRGTEEGDFSLGWTPSPAVDGYYYIYRSADPYYAPGPGDPTYATLEPWIDRFLDEESGIGDPARNFTYLLCAWFGTEMDCAPRTGEFDFGLVAGAPLP